MTLASDFPFLLPCLLTAWQKVAGSGSQAVAKVAEDRTTGMFLVCGSVSLKSGLGLGRQGPHSIHPLQRAVWTLGTPFIHASQPAQEADTQEEKNGDSEGLNGFWKVPQLMVESHRHPGLGSSKPASRLSHALPPPWGHSNFLGQRQEDVRHWDCNRDSGRFYCLFIYSFQSEND